MIRAVWATIRVGTLDLRGDLRRFVLLVVCLAVGTALIAGVNSVGTSVAAAVDNSAAELMGGDLELSRADRPATGDELQAMATFGTVASVVDTNLRAQSDAGDAFLDLTAVGDTYPLLGAVQSVQMPAGESISDFLDLRDGVPGALVDPLLLDQLGIAVGDDFQLGGTTFQARGILSKLPDAPVRGFRLGLTTLVTLDGFAGVSDRTSPLPGLGSWFRYKILLKGQDAEAARFMLESQFASNGWTVRSARDGLGPMVRYYDLFMRFLVIVGLGSLLIGGVSVWAGMQAYISERANVIAILRSMGADRWRVFLHFSTQIAALAAVGVGIGLLIGGGVAYFILPLVGEAVGISLAPALYIQPLLVAAGAGFATAFGFAYLPLQQAQTIRPVYLFRSKGLAAAPFDWQSLLASWQVLPLLAILAVFLILAVAMTGDMVLVAAFASTSLLAVAVLRLFIGLAQWALRRVPEPPTRIVRHALRAIASPGSNAASVVIAAGMALTMLIVVLVLQGNLRQEFLGASSFDVPTLVASDLFPDEVDILDSMSGPATDITQFVATPMLRGALTAINGVATATVRTRGPEATFLLSGEVPLTFRSPMPASSRMVDGTWWPADYDGPGLVSLHQSLRSGLGVNIGDTLTFVIFGDTVTVQIASFRDYSWQGGIDFLATFSPGVLDPYPMTLFAAVTTRPNREEAVERSLAAALPDIRFIAIGDTLEQITSALGQLSFAAALVGGLAVGNGLLVLVVSLASGRRQREADAVIGKVLGATRAELLATALVQYFMLAVLATIPAAVLGIGFAYVVSLVMLDVVFVLPTAGVLIVAAAATLLTACLGSLAILRATSSRPARLLRNM